MAEGKTNKTNLIILTPYDEFFEGFVDSVMLPSQDGSVGIMAGHMPLVLAIFPGVVSIKNGDSVKYCFLSEGYAEIGQHISMVVCNSAEWPEQIDVRRAYKNLIDRTNDLKDAPAGYYKIKDWKDQISRSKARLHVVELYGSEQQKKILESLRAGEKI